MQILLKLRRRLWPLYIRFLLLDSHIILSFITQASQFIIASSKSFSHFLRILFFVAEIKRLPPIHSLVTIRITGLFLLLLLSHIYKLILHFSIAKPEHIIMLQSLLGIGRHLLVIDPTTIQGTLILQIRPCKLIVHLDTSMLAGNWDIINLDQKVRISANDGDLVH